MILTKKIKEDIIKHAKESYPNESCGLVLSLEGNTPNKEYMPCKNLSASADQFYIDPKDIVRSEAKGNILAYVHSHPNGSCKPSEPDLAQMALHGKAWIICSYEPDVESEVGIYEPEAYRVPLLGRSYHHGLQDCYSIVRDYYYRELNIRLNDYERLDNWWLEEDTKSLYLDNFSKEGFIPVTDGIRKHDVILFTLGRTFHVNHAGIFLGDGDLTSEDSPKVIGNSLFIHHPYNKKALREIYGNFWEARTTFVLRHESLLDQELIQ